MLIPLYFSDNTNTCLQNIFFIEHVDYVPLSRFHMYTWCNLYVMIKLVLNAHCCTCSDSLYTMISTKSNEMWIKFNTKLYFQNKKGKMLLWDPQCWKRCNREWSEESLQKVGITDASWQKQSSRSHRSF